MIKFITIVFMFAVANGQYFLPPVVQQPYFYQAPQFYHPQPQYYQPPVYYPQYTPQVPAVVPKTTLPQAQSSINEIKGVVPDNFKGFGYHTNYNDGATSTVVFFNGPNSLANTFNAKNSVTIASDSLDPQNKENLEKATSRSGKSFPSTQLDSFAMIRSILDHPNFLGEGINYFTADFSAPGYPASTIPLNLNQNITTTTEVNASSTTTEISASSTTESTTETATGEGSESTENDINSTTEQIEETTTI